MPSKQYRLLTFDRPVKILKSLVKNIIKSSLFLAVFVSAFRFMMCFTKNTRQKIDRWNVIISSFVCAFAILFEPASRRSEIAMYLVPRALESLWTMQLRNGRVRNIPFGEELVFAVSMAVLMYCYQNKPHVIKPSYLSLFKQFFGEN